MKILLAGINSQYFHSNLAIRYLKAAVRDLPVEVEIAEYTINERKEHILEQIIEAKPDIIGFSTYIWNTEYVQAISKLIHRVNPDIEIFYGGPEVTYEAEKFLQGVPGQYLIEGEGEGIFRQFVINKARLTDLEEYKDIKDIRGLYIKTEDGIHYTGEAIELDMVKCPFPYEEGDDLENKIVYYEASRGCPFRCKYCLSCVSKTLKFHDIKRVEKELDFLLDKKVKLVKFVDRTFNADNEFAIKIWEYLISKNTKTTFHFEIAAEILSDEAIEVLGKAPKGRFQFEVGVQSTDLEVLRNINRNVKFETLAKKVKAVDSYGNIMQHLDLIAGLPGEDYETFKKSFNDVHNLGIDEIQLGFLKLIKGSPMRAEAEQWGMEYSPYPPYEILKTDHITYEELLKLKKIEAMVNKYHNSGKFDNILAYIEDAFETPFDFYEKLSVYFKEQGFFSRSIAVDKYYEVFVGFNDELVKRNEVYLKNIIKYDYLVGTKKKWVPTFLREDKEKKILNLIRKNLQESNLKMNNNSFIEKFDIDIIKYVEQGILEEKSTYVLFNVAEDLEIVDVTQYNVENS